MFKVLFLYFFTRSNLRHIIAFMSMLVYFMSVLFQDFARRMHRDVKKLVDARLTATAELSGGNLTVCFLPRVTFCVLYPPDSFYSSR